MIATAALGVRATMAGPPPNDIVLLGKNTPSTQGLGAPLVLADASVTLKGDQWTSRPASLAKGMVRPPAEKQLITDKTGLTSAAIIRPLKDKKFALAFVADAPTPGQSPPFGLRPSLFRASPAIIATPGSQEALSWVVLADTMPTARNAFGEESIKAGVDDAAWHYSMEMIYVPIASLTIRAALSMATLEEEIDAARTSPALARSRIGLAIGLGLRPKNGVLVDVDYAHVMKDAADYLNPSAGETSHTIARERDGTGEDLISISLSIQF